MLYYVLNMLNFMCLFIIISSSVKRHELWCTVRDMRLSKCSIIVHYTFNALYIIVSYLSLLSSPSPDSITSCRIISPIPFLFILYHKTLLPLPTQKNLTTIVTFVNPPANQICVVINPPISFRKIYEFNLF